MHFRNEGHFFMKTAPENEGENSAGFMSGFC